MSFLLSFFLPASEPDGMKIVRCHLRSIVLLSLGLTAGLLVSIGTAFLISTYHGTVIIERQIPDYQSKSGSVIRKKNVTIQTEVYNMKDKIAELAKKIYKAKKHVRGIKTADSLTGAINILEDILDDLHINSTLLKQRNAVPAKSVCPEEFKGTTYGYPFFYKGFETKECDHGKPVTDLLTITAYIKKTNSSKNIEKAVDKLIRSMYRHNSSYHVVLAADISSTAAAKFTNEFSNLIIKDTFAIRGLSAGKVWNNLVEYTKTPYVFIARNVEMLTSDTRFERLIREIESLSLAAAGGAFRTPDGHWTNGCHQVAYKNYSMSFYHGYDESMHECIFCDYIEGPFIASKKILNDFKFKNFEDTDGLFEDWFLRLKLSDLEVVVCPDSMFHTFDKVIKKEKWNLFMVDWDLYQLHTPHGKTVLSPCNRGMSFLKSKATSPCGLKSLADGLKFLMASCENANITCELQEGTALGAVKFNKILPWERDADIAFLSANYSAFKNLRSKFETSKYRFIDLAALWCCADNRTAGGKFQIGVPGWTIEMYGQHMMDSELLLLEGMKPTKVPLDGKWVNMPRNPGLFVRNRYGHEIYRHSVHWMTLGQKNGWINYKTDHFLNCDDPGHHACLDRYNPDGNLQFNRPLP